jgi:anti-sigma regulatory factor (Ser/Thr protein kinase)
VIPDDLAAAAPSTDPAAPAFRHDALLYRSDVDYVAGTVPFIRAGLAAGEPVLVALPPVKLDLVQRALGADASRVRFADMITLGRNPARIIPAWADFLAEAGEDQPVRGIGEPVWAGRSEVEVAEAQLHEELLNRAFAGRPGFWLRCPYDVTGLAPEVVAAAHHSHAPDGGMEGVATGSLAGELPEPPAGATRLDFDLVTLPAVRQAVRERAALGGQDAVRRLVLAVHEVAANSVRHGGGRGTLRTWRDGDAAVFEVRDRGRIDDPLVGRQTPPPDAHGGRGVWLANQLCDLVQIRSGAAGTVVRMYRQL